MQLSYKSLKIHTEAWQQETIQTITEEETVNDELSTECHNCQQHWCKTSQLLDYGQLLHDRKSNVNSRKIFTTWILSQLLQVHITS